MGKMTRAEAMNKIENVITKHIPEGESAELFNFQSYGFSNNYVNEMLKEVIDNNPDLDPDGEFEAIQSILTFFPSKERMRSAAFADLSHYDSEEEFIEELGGMDKAKIFYEDSYLTEEEFHSAFRKG